MRIIVDDLPRMPKECLFGWKHLEYSKWRCKFGGECELSTECRQCSHLVTFATDTNVGTKDGTNLAEVGTDFISRKQALSFPFANGQYDHENADEHFIFGCEAYKEWLEQLPSAEPQTGKWIRVDNLHMRCNRCDVIHLIAQHPRGNIDYCPNCGAKMEVDNEQD